MRTTSTGTLISVVLLAASTLAFATPTARSTVSASGRGPNLFAANSTSIAVTGGLVSEGVWSAEAEDRDGNGKVEFVTVRCQTPLEERWIRFGTNEPGRDLEHTGEFRHAGPELYGYVNVLEGTEASDPEAHAGFAVLDVQIDWSDSSPRVDRFVARFAGRSRYDSRNGFGLVVFEGTAIPEIGRVSYSRETRRLEILGNGIELADRVWIDGVEYPLKIKGDVASARRVRLADGTHTVRIGSAAGFVSADQHFEVSDTDPVDTSSCVLRLNSSPGEYLGQGIRRRVRATYAGAAGFDETRDGQIDGIRLAVTEDNSTWFVQFGSAPMGLNLTRGLYPDSLAHPDSPGHPSFEITGESRGCQDYAGSFTIESLVFDWSQAIAVPTVVDVAFDVRCNFTSPLLRGSIRYATPGVPVISNIDYDPAARELRLTVLNLDGEIRMTLDAAERGPVRVTGDEAVLSLVDLEPGRHVVWIDASDSFGESNGIPAFFDVGPQP